MSQPETPLVVACTLGHVDLAAQRARWERLRRDAEVDRVVTEAGIQLIFRSDAAVELELRSLLEVETECCAWARWTVVCGDKYLVLSVSSTGDAVAALQAMFQI